MHQFPAPLDRGVISARAILEQRLIYIADATEDSRDLAAPDCQRCGSYAAIPLMRDGKAVGAISMDTSRALVASPTARSSC